MEYLLSLSDGSQSHMVVLALNDKLVQQNAIDIVLDLIGCEDVDALISAKVLAPGYVDDLKAMQDLIFDRDAQGLFIREQVYFTANGRDLNPDAPMIDSFAPADRDGVRYMRCDLTAITSLSNVSEKQAENAKEYSQIFFLHQIAIGKDLDVTKDHLEVDTVLKQCEKEELIEIDVKTASYRTTERGKSRHDAYIAEAQDLIKRYDIFGDVDIDMSGTARFDTGLGRDLRVPIFELEGVDPFRARFLLGINDGEWDKLPEWTDLVENPEFYAKMMEPVERAPSVEEIGKNRLLSIIDQGKAVLRR